MKTTRMMIKMLIIEGLESNFTSYLLGLSEFKKKKLLILCAQNPASSEDAKFTQTMQLDAAVENIHSYLL